MDDKYPRLLWRDNNGDPVDAPADAGDWKRIIAEATNGGALIIVTLVCLPGRDGWIVKSVLREAEEGRRPYVELKADVVAALRAAGKAVID
jgi:hypothetical protein